MNKETQKSLSGEIGYILSRSSRPGPGDFWSVIQRAYQAGRLDQAMEVNRRTAYESAVISGMIGEMSFEDLVKYANKFADLMMHEEEEQIAGDQIEQIAEDQLND